MDQQMSAAMETVIVVGQLIRELGSVPSGVLYSRLMDKMSLTEYRLILDILSKGGMIVEKNHLITWKGGN